MKLVYIDESGTHENSPVVVFVGVITDTYKVHKTRREFDDTFKRLEAIPAKELKELKSTKLYGGKGPWYGVPPDVRHRAFDEFVDWIDQRGHKLALSALNRAAFATSELKDRIADEWLAGALHIALQLQRAHQGGRNNKGATMLIFDEQLAKADALLELLHEPPDWTDAYYQRRKAGPALDTIMDSAYFARSHHASLVQVADLFAFVFRRHAELSDFAAEPAYDGEGERIADWARRLGSRLIGRPHRWPQAAVPEASGLFNALAPPSLVALK